MKLISGKLYSVINDEQCANPKSYDYGWYTRRRVIHHTLIIEDLLRLSLLPEDLRDGWWLYKTAFTRRFINAIINN